VQLGKVLANEILAHMAACHKNKDYRGADDDLGWAMLDAAEIIS